jgi:ribonuclease P protein component
MVVYHLKTSPMIPLRVGFVVSKKVGNSPVRSRSKRLMREAMRNLMAALPQGVDVVVVARPPLAEEDYDGVYKVMAKLLKKAKLLGDENL